MQDEIRMLELLFRVKALRDCTTVRFYRLKPNNNLASVRQQGNRPDRCDNNSRRIDLHDFRLNFVFGQGYVCLQIYHHIHYVDCVDTLRTLGVNSP